jgi:hypothetical protein
MTHRGWVGLQWEICLFWRKKIFKNLLQNSASWPISIEFDTNYLCIKGIKICINKGPDPLQRGGNCKNRWWLVSFKFFFFENHWARKAQIYMKASWYSANRNLFYHGPHAGEMGSQLGKTVLYSWVIPLQNQRANFNQTWCKLSLNEGNSRLFK